MTEAPHILVHRANQISRFFATQPEGAAGVAQHLRLFWDPSMRAEIIAWRAAGGEGLETLAAEGVDLLGVAATAAP
jgi:formate dehydrogenase subunit delta